MSHLVQNNFLSSIEKPAFPAKGKSAPKNIAQKSSGRWSKEEHQRFIDGLKKFGKNWKLIEDYIGTRNGAQVRSHAQKFFNRLGKDFDSKLKDDDLQAENKLKEIFRKTSGSSLDTAYSSQAVESQGRSSQASPIDMSPAVTETLINDPKSPDSMKLGPISNSLNKGTDKEGAFRQESVKKQVTNFKAGSLSLFSLLISKIKTSNNEIIFPKLSDIVNTSTSYNCGVELCIPELSDKDTLNLGSSFRIHKKSNMEMGFIVTDKINKLRAINNFEAIDINPPVKKLKIN